MTRPPERGYNPDVATTDPHRLTPEPAARLARLRSQPVTAANDQHDERGRFGSKSGGDSGAPAPTEGKAFGDHGPGSGGEVDAAVSGAMDRYKQDVTDRFGLDVIQPGEWGYQSSYGGIYRAVSEPDPETGVARIAEIGQYGDGSHDPRIEVNFDTYKPADLKYEDYASRSRAFYGPPSKASAADAVLDAQAYLKSGDRPPDADQ